MAEKKDQDLLNEVEKLKAQLAESEGKYKALEAEAVASGKVAIPITGSFKVGKKKYSFAPGTVHVRDKAGMILPTEVVMKIANEAEYKVEDELLSEYPALADFDQAAAKEFLAYLVEIKYGLLQ